MKNEMNNEINNEIDNEIGNDINNDINDEVINETEEISQDTDIHEPSDNGELKCASCGTVIKPGMSFCPECGKPMSNICSKCGAELEDKHKFCPICGTPRKNEVGKSQSDDAEENDNNFFKIMISLIVAACVIVGIIIAVVLTNNSNDYDDDDYEPPFAFATEFGEYVGESWCRIASDGSYMKIDTNPNNTKKGYDSDAGAAISKVNEELGFSDALLEKMAQTRALDGKQTEENTRFRVTWTYHPNNGLEVLYEKK